MLELELLLASGETVHLSREQDGAIFRCACVGLGCLGIILSAKLQCEPAFNLYRLRYGANLFEVILLPREIAPEQETDLITHFWKSIKALNELNKPIQEYSYKNFVIYI